MDIKSYAATIMVSVASGWALQFLGPKTRLCYWFPHSFIYNITLEGGIPYVIQTSSITVQNLGRKGAENIEIIHQTRPDHFQFFPSRPFQEDSTNNGEHIIRVESLGPNEFFTLQILSFLSLPNQAPLLNIRSKDGRAKQIPTQLQRLWPKWFNILVWTVIFIGIWTSVIWLTKGIMYLTHRESV